LPTLFDLAVRYDAAVNAAIVAVFKSHPHLFDPPDISGTEMARLVQEQLHVPPDVKTAIPNLSAELDLVAVHEALKKLRREKLEELLKTRS